MPYAPSGRWVPEIDVFTYWSSGTVDPEAAIEAEDTMDALLWRGLVQKDIGADGTEWFQGLEHVTDSQLDNAHWFFHGDEEPPF